MSIFREVLIGRSDFATRLDNAASSSPSNKVIDALDVELAKQRTKLIDATTILPTYDQRQCELVITFPCYFYSKGLIPGYLSSN